MTQRRPLVTFDGRVRELPAGDTLADATLGTELTGLSQLGTTGIMVRTGAGTYATRTITGTTNQVNVSNGDGVLGNPTLSTPQNIHTGASPTFAGITLSGMTAGSVLFAGSGGLISQDNSNLFWDDSNNRLGIGTASPGEKLSIGYGTNTDIALGTSTNNKGYLGTYANGVAFTINRRVNDGAFADVTQGTASIGLNSLNPGGYITFSTSNTSFTLDTERMRVTQTGNILIGTTTETASSGLIQLATGTTAARGILWGTDTNLYRSAANTLKTDDSLVVSSGLSVSTLTTGSIPYIGAGGAIGDNNANLFWDNGGTALLIRSNSIGTNGALQVNGTVGVGSSGTNYIRPITNADVVSLILLATQVVVGNVNSDTYSYSGGGRLAVVTNADSHTLLDVGRNTSTNARFKVVNTTSGQAYTTFENSTTTAFRSFTVTGETIFGASSLATGEGRIHVAPHTTKAGGLYFGAANTNLYSSASGALKTDGVLTIAGITASTSSTTGALIVSGGVGIAKDSWINSVRVGLGGGNLSNNLVIGTSALAATNSGTGKNIAIGQSALAANTTGYQNIAIGWEAIKTGATGNGNIAIGHGAQTSVTGAANISIGNGNLGSLGAANYNVAIGHASQDTATSQYNTSVGGLTLRAASGLSNTAVGYQAGTAVSTGYQNTLIGNSAGVGTTTGFQNTFLGYQAGYHNVGGITNTMVGYNAGVGINSGSYNTIIGAAQWTYPTTLNNNIVLADGQGNIKYRYDATNVTYTANSGYHSFVSTGSAEQVRITHTASASRYITLTGSNGGNPTINVSAGSLAITPATVFASTISALAITGNSFIPNSATVPTNGMYLEAANNPAFAANSTKIFEYDSTGIQIAGTITTPGGATFHTTSTALTNGAGAGAGTLTNAPAAGDPTKWIGINDNGTTRYIPAW